MTTYELVTFNNPGMAILATTEATEYQTAMRELKAWAQSHGHRLAKSPTDSEATCIVVENLGILGELDILEPEDEPITPADLEEFDKEIKRVIDHLPEEFDIPASPFDLGVDFDHLGVECAELSSI